MDRHILFFHGLESGPHGRKYHALSKHFDVESPDFQGMDLEERLAKATALTDGARDLIVVGSSFGGLLAALMYVRFPERFFGYVLAAPALHYLTPEELPRMPENVAVVHARQDDVVPIGPVRDLCAQHGVRIIEVDDDHSLSHSADILIAETERLVQARGRR